MAKNCPKCGASDRLHQSHSRNGFERLVKKVTPYRMFRCHACNHRLWLWEGRWFRTRKRGLVRNRLPWWVWVGALIVAIALGRLLVR